MMKILALDPGDRRTGWVVFIPAEFRLEDFGLTENGELLSWILAGRFHCNRLIAELVKGYGNPIGDSLLETALWTGRFIQAFDGAFDLIPRKTIVTHICGRSTAGDKHIRQALIDSFPATGGGKIPAIGIKSNPGPLYGVTGDVWAALALAAYWAEVFEWAR